MSKKKPKKKKKKRKKNLMEDLVIYSSIFVFLKMPVLELRTQYGGKGLLASSSVFTAL